MASKPNRKKQLEKLLAQRKEEEEKNKTATAFRNIFVKAGILEDKNCEIHRD